MSCWLVWRGAAWSPDTVGIATDKIRRLVEAERAGALDLRDRAAMGRIKFVFAVEQISRTDPLMAVEQGMFDEISPGCLAPLTGL